jgi:hypothetical protein
MRTTHGSDIVFEEISFDGRSGAVFQDPILPNGIRVASIAQ